MTLDRRTLLGGAAALAGSAAMGLGQTKAPANAPAKVGEVKTAGIRLIPIDGGKYKVWTKKVGSGRIKVLTLHGGPGVTHEYFECFEDFLPQRGSVLLLRPAGRPIRPAGRREPLDDRPIPGGSRAGARGAGARGFLSPRALLGQHAASSMP
jgi:hypothetical protein